MKKNTTLLIALISWFAVITQFILMINNRVESVPETIVRFFSFFTILTNILVAVYFTSRFINSNKSNRPGNLTAVTMYITIVGLVYQIVLRPIWDPTGLQKIVDELLHSVIPLCVIIYWAYFEVKSEVRVNQIPKWLIYPFVYLLYILIRGKFSNFYPYPFVDVTTLGMKTVLMNSFILVIIFLVIAFLFVFLGKLFTKNK